MIILKEIKQSKVLVIGESYGKVSDDALPFIDEQSSLALRVGFQTSAPENFVTPDFIEINNPLNVDLDQSTIDSLKDLFNLYEYVVCVGRTPLKAWFNSLSKGRSMETITNSPFLEPLEYPKLKVGVLPHFKSAFSKDSEDPLSDYWDKIKYLFADKPNYNCTETKINNEQEFVQLLHFLDTLPNDTILGLDYETNAVDQFNVDFQVTMYGLAYLVDKHNAKGFWYHPPKNEPLSDFAMQHWKAFLDRNHKRIWAYNVPFEIKTTWDQVGEMYRMQDAMVLMTVQGKRGSLKNIMRSELGASLWESSVHEFMDITEAMFKYTKRSKNRDTIEEMFKNHDLEGLRKLHKNFDKWFNMILEDYEESDILHALDNYPHPWASVPPNVLGPYCAKDAGFALLLVANYLTDEYKQAYEFYMNHPWLATKFEVNGCPWDDGIATMVKADLSKQALDRLYNVIMNLDTISQEQKMLAKDTYFKELPYEIISYTEKQKKERRTQIKSDLDKVEILKTIFNPNSNTEDSRKLFWDSYLTNDITLGTIMNIFIEDMEFNQALKPLYDILGHDFIKTNSIQVILEKISDPDKFIIDKNLSNQCKKSLQKAISEYKDMLGKFSTDLIKNQYQVHKRWLGLKIDNEETWSKNWRLVFDLFLFKKITKTISTNIDGKTGRSLVTEIVGRKWGKPLRGRYWEDKPEDESWDDKETILNNSFNSLSADTLRWSSSFHCLVGSTGVLFKNGKSITMEQLYNMKKEGKFPSDKEVYSVNEGTTDLIEDTITDVLLSGYTDTTIRITLENGQVVEGTPDHRMLKTDGTYIRLCDIDENTELAEVKSYTIYKLYHEKDPTKLYIGCTSTSVQEKFRMHFKNYPNRLVKGLIEPVEKYGLDGWKIEPIIENILCKKEAYRLESEEIIKRKTNDPKFGYNLKIDDSELATRRWKDPKVRKHLETERKTRYARLGKEYQDKMKAIQSRPDIVAKKKETLRKTQGHKWGTGENSTHPLELLQRIYGLQSLIFAPKDLMASYFNVPVNCIKNVRLGKFPKLEKIVNMDELKSFLEFVGGKDLNYDHIILDENRLKNSERFTYTGKFKQYLQGKVKL